MLQDQGVLSEVKTLKNGVRIANVKDHRDKSKAEKQGQTFFPSSWSDSEISKAVKNNWRENLNDIPKSGYQKFESEYAEIKITVGYLNGKPENAYPNKYQ